VVHRHSTSFEELDPRNHRAMLQSVEIEKHMPRDFPLLTIGLASEAALQGQLRRQDFAGDPEVVECHRQEDDRPS
jgi:hypothetical protein